MAFHPEALVTVDSGAAELAEEFTIRVDAELAREFSHIETSFVAVTHAHLRHLGLKFVWIVLFCLYNGQRQVCSFEYACINRIADDAGVLQRTYLHAYETDPCLPVTVITSL